MDFLARSSKPPSLWRFSAGLPHTIRGAIPWFARVARALRDKLNEYYLNGGAGDPIRIELPKGSYVPQFTGIDPKPMETSQPSLPRRQTWGRIVAIMGGCALLASPGDSVKALRKTTPGTSGASSGAFFQAGRERLLSGDFTRARPLLENAAFRSPADPMIHAALARDLMALGYNALALDEARKAEAAGGRLTSNGELEVEATFRSASGDHQAAATAYEELATRYPERLEYSRSLANEQLLAGRPGDCLRTTARGKDPADAQLALTEAYCRAAAGDFLGALDPARRTALAASKLGQRETYAHARLVEAGLLMSTNHGADAMAPRDEARRICTEIGDDACVIRALRIEANTEIKEMRPAVALAAYRAAQPLAHRIGSTKEIIELLDGEGYARMLMDDFAGSNAAFIDALLNAQRASSRTAGVRQDMVELALAQGQLDRAVILAEQAAQDSVVGSDRVAEAPPASSKRARCFCEETWPGAPLFSSASAKPSGGFT